MKRINLYVCKAIVFVLPVITMVFCSCNKNPDRLKKLRASFPVIDSIFPTKGPFNTLVTVYGKNLGDNSSRFGVNGAKAEVKSCTDTKCIIVVSGGAGSGPIVDSTKYGRGSGSYFTYIQTDTWVVETFAGSGEPDTTNGQATRAKFNKPRGLAVDAIGNVYVADAGNNMIRKIAEDQTVTLIAGTKSPGFADNANGNLAQFNNPTGIAVDGNYIYVADAGNHRIRRIDLKFPYAVTTIAGTGTLGNADNATGTSATFSSPTGIAYFANILYIADKNNHRIRMVNTAPPFAVTPLIGSTAGFSDVLPVRFNSPTGLYVSSTGTTLFVADSGNHRLRRITPVASTSAASSAGSGSADFKEGSTSNAAFNGPTGVYVDAFSFVYIADWNNHRIRVTAYNALDISTFAGSSISTPIVNGVATIQATFNAPSAMVKYSGRNTFYVADAGDHRIRKLEYKKY